MELLRDFSRVDPEVPDVSGLPSDFRLKQVAESSLNNQVRNVESTKSLIDFEANQGRIGVSSTIPGAISEVLEAAAMSMLSLDESFKQAADCASDYKELYKGADRQEDMEATGVAKLTSRRVTAIAFQSLEAEAVIPLSKVEADLSDSVKNDSNRLLKDEVVAKAQAVNQAVRPEDTVVPPARAPAEIGSNLLQKHDGLAKQQHAREPVDGEDIGGSSDSDSRYDSLNLLQEHYGLAIQQRDMGASDGHDLVLQSMTNGSSSLEQDDVLLKIQNDREPGRSGHMVLALGCDSVNNDPNLLEKDGVLSEQQQEKEQFGCKAFVIPCASGAIKNGTTRLPFKSRALTSSHLVLAGVEVQNPADADETEYLSAEQDLDSVTEDETSESPRHDSLNESDEEEAEDSSYSQSEVPLTDEEVQELLDDLLKIESEVAEAQEMLEEESLERVREDVRVELSETLSGPVLDAKVEEELSIYKEEWEEQCEELLEQTALLQEKLEEAGVCLPDFYKEMEKQAPEGCSTEAWKQRTHWAGHEPTQEIQVVVKRAEEELKVRHPTRRKRGKILDEGASGFLERKFGHEGADHDAGTSKSESPNADGWSKVEEFLDNEDTPEPGKLMGTKRWAAVYLASTPEQAAQLGLTLPGVDIVEEIGDMESERQPLFKAAFANEKEHGLTDRQKKSIKKVREEDDVKRSRRMQKQQMKRFSHHLRVKKPQQESQTHLADVGRRKQLVQSEQQTSLLNSNGCSGKQWNTDREAELIVILSDDEGVHDSGPPVIIESKSSVAEALEELPSLLPEPEMSYDKKTELNRADQMIAKVDSNHTRPEQHTEIRTSSIQPAGDPTSDVSETHKHETLTTFQEDIEQAIVKSESVDQAHVEYSSVGRTVMIGSNDGLPGGLEELPPVPPISPVRELCSLKKRRVHDGSPEGCDKHGDGDDNLSKRSRSLSFGGEAELSDRGQKEVQGSIIDQTASIGHADFSQSGSLDLTTLFRTTVVIDSDGEREVEEAVPAKVNSTITAPRSQNLKNSGLEGLNNVKSQPGLVIAGGSVAERVDSHWRWSKSGIVPKKRKFGSAERERRDFPCTACGMPLKRREVLRHPKLAVGICKKCKKHYLSGPFLTDEDGSECECSWCGEGGEVVCCGRCDKVFCQKCISRNFGDAEAMRIVSIDDWLCYFCNPTPLSTFAQQLMQAEMYAKGTYTERGGPDDDRNTLADQEATAKQSKKGKHRKNIRKVLDDDELEEKQKEVLALEKERQERLEQWRTAAGHSNHSKKDTPIKKISKEAFEPDEENTSDGLLINAFRAEGEVAVPIAPRLADILKPHQIQGVRFMWENCIVSEDRVKAGVESFGCILAHSMGLGKTLQVITFVHTVLNRDMGLRTVLIVVPVNVLHNWKREFEIWQAEITNPVSVYILEDMIRENTKRATLLSKWQEDGGVMLIGYTAFRNLSLGKHVKERTTRDALCKSLQNPGPDVLVCDEAHTIKNRKADITQVLKQVKTRRRIALTGSPLQNNLMEYYCMVDFVREGFLGSPPVFKNRFQNPIENGQHADSTNHDVRVMKQRAHVLHKQLKGFVQRMNMTVLKDELPPKCVYVISVRLSPLQRQLYAHYLQVHGLLQDEDEVMENKSQRKFLFNAYHALAKVWNHPDLLLMAEEKNRKPEDPLDDFIADSDEDDGDIGADEGKAKVPNTHRQVKKKGSNELDELEKPLWWKDIITPDFTREDMELSGKMVLLLRLLKMISWKGDKALVFSQSLGTLDIIERFLESKLHEDNGKYWQRDKHWYRLDGSTPAAGRMQMCEAFNDPSNIDVKCVLISTRAGSLGINLPAANRVIIVDGSWNPTHDLQALFRAWRLGQKKPVYAYRLLAHGTMEEKIYSRQVAKEGVAARVLDEQQVGRLFAGDDLEFLFRLDDDGDDFVLESEKSLVVPTGAALCQGGISPDGALATTVSLGSTSRSKLLTFTLPVDAPPRDDLMGKLLIEFRPRWVVSYHEHEPLLEHREEENLTSEEQAAAWASYMVEGAHQNWGTTVIQTSAALTSTIITQNTMQPVQNPVGNLGMCTRKDHAAILSERSIPVGGDLMCAVCFTRISWENLPWR